MKVFVYHTGHTGYVHNIIAAMKDHIEISSEPDASCDVFLSLQMGHHAELIRLKRSFPHVKFVTYVWDCYDWIWEQGRGYDWKGYGELCQVSDMVWVPSQGQVLRLKQHWGIEKYDIVKCYAQFFDHDAVSDGGYVSNPLREIPDPQLGWIEKACTELDIPYEHGGRKQGQTGRTWDEYKDFIAKASFIVCPWYEASTGGMSLLEGYNLGKEVLICDSPYLGASDYFGYRANYFEPNYEDMKRMIGLMWSQRYTFPSKPLEDKQEFCKEFTADAFAERIVKGFNKLL